MNAASPFDSSMDASKYAAISSRVRKVLGNVVGRGSGLGHIFLLQVPRQPHGRLVTRSRWITGVGARV